MTDRGGLMMGPRPNAQAPLFAGGRPGTLKLVVLLALAIMLMLADRQRGFLVVGTRARAGADAAGVLAGIAAGHRF